MKAFLTTSLVVAAVAVAVAVLAFAHPRPFAAMQLPAPVGASNSASAANAAYADKVAAADQVTANGVLAQLKTRYRYLNGVTVQMGTTPNGEQAIAYYTDGRIVISRDHYVSIEKILAHEVWHVIDWRDNGRIDWGEDLPPKNASVYSRG